MATTFVLTEFPMGANNGTNTVFMLSNTPDPPGSVSVRLDGLRLKQMFDFAVNAHAITMITPPSPNDVLVASYFYDA